MSKLNVINSFGRLTRQRLQKIPFQSQQEECQVSE
jgi:hypothetical protein